MRWGVVLGKLVVDSIGIAEILDLLHTNTWMVPAFQRDFVWSEAEVTSLALSVIEARPIGMATLWEQPDDSDLELMPASIPDTKDGVAVDVALSVDQSKPKKFFAVLDGRQRSTALAMAFGGLRASDARRRFSGRFYLDVTHDDPSERVRYLKDAQVNALKLDQLSVCIGQGLFPLATESGVGLLGQWLGYVQAIKDPLNYPDKVLPQDDELQRRDVILKQAFEGISQTVLAVYTVPADYTLGEICEIFETLNTTGTKVSTVDLLHSWLYNDTSDDPEPILLRDWIEDLGQLEGAVGWASKANRPEIVAQAVTACYVIMDSEKPQPRAVGGKKKPANITSIKAGDLLATPAEFWKEVVLHDQSLAHYFGDFQECVSGARFPLSECPYPVTIAMYSALRWYMDHDSRYAQQWTLEELNALFRAFFWRNSLTGRYDQGFLSQSTTDLKALKETLFRRAQEPSANAWAIYANHTLTNILGMRQPQEAELVSQLLHTKPAGALGRALSLPVRTRPMLDLLDPSESIAYPGTKGIDVHHIFPLAWCNNNQHGSLAPILDPNRAEFDYSRSVANLTPLIRKSNNVWRAKAPGQALAQHEMSYDIAKERLDTHFISHDAYAALTADSPNPLAFWTTRASDIATYLVERCVVQL